MDDKPLRICIICKENLVPLWLAKVIERLVNLKAITISVMAVEEGCGKPQGKSPLNKILDTLRNHKVLIYRIYSFLSTSLTILSNSALKPTPISHVCGDTPHVSLRYTNLNGSVQVEESDLCLLQGFNIDLIICCGIAPVNLGAQNIAAHGAWYVEDCDDPYIVNAETGAWEILEGYPTLKMEIKRRVGGKLRPESLCRSILPTYIRDGLCPIHGIRDVKLWTASAWLCRLIERLYTLGPNSITEHTPHQVLDAPVESEPIFPTNRQMGTVISRKIRRKCLQTLGKANRFDEWQIAFMLDDQVPLNALDGSGFSPIEPPRGFFWADPVPVKGNGSHFIFLEELPFASGKGHISVIQIDAAGNWTPPTKVLERPYHLSYPFVFEWNGDYYMVPETASNRTVELYRADPFPFKWTLEKVLLENIKAVDSTLAFRDDMWWMFAATMPYEEISDDNFMELNIFYAEAPCGPWFPHPKNPVKSDSRNSRPAGGLIMSNAELLRPAQNCFRAYGNAISINTIELLTTKDFSEREAWKIEPSIFRGARRIHTIGRCEGLTVVDLAFKVRDE